MIKHANPHLSVSFSRFMLLIMLLRNSQMARMSDAKAIVPNPLEHASLMPVQMGARVRCASVMVPS